MSELASAAWGENATPRPDEFPEPQRADLYGELPEDFGLLEYEEVTPPPQT